jgi:hypothetical protein
MATRNALEVVEIVKTCDVGPIPVPSETGDDFRFRIEIVRLEGRKRRFQARVWRIENYRVQPTFPQIDGQPSDEPCDELLLARDHFFDDGSVATTPAAALKNILQRIHDRFLS